MSYVPSYVASPIPSDIANKKNDAQHFLSTEKHISIPSHGRLNFARWQLSKHAQRQH
jgi:hypothetical protein